MVYVKFRRYVCINVILTKNAADEYQKGTCAHWIGQKIMPWDKTNEGILKKRRKKQNIWGAMVLNIHSLQQARVL